MKKSAQEEYTLLDGKRKNLLNNCEKYALLTQPSLFPPVGVNPDDRTYALDYQSLGSDGLNNVANKMLLASFAPGKPFYMVRINKRDKKIQQMLEQTAKTLGVTANELLTVFTAIEREGAEMLDDLSLRPALLRAYKLLLATGNALIRWTANEVGDSVLRTQTLRNYVVKRDISGWVCKLIVRETLEFEDLKKDAQEEYLLASKARAGATSAETKVTVYERFTWNPESKGYDKDFYVDEVELTKYAGHIKAKDMEYRVLTWELPDENDYGIGLVQQRIGDLSAYSLMAQAVTDGAIQALEIRWLVNQTSSTSVEVFNASVNGDAIAGRKEDIVPVSGGSPGAVEAGLKVQEVYERRLRSAFLMPSVRDAERVTATEVRQAAMELEVQFGGAYSHLAPQIQLPVAQWIIQKVEPRLLNGESFKLRLVTGLSVLSRNAEAESLLLAIQDLGQTATLPELLLKRIKFGALARAVGAGRGVDLDPVLMSDEEVATSNRNEAARTVATETGVAQGQAQAQAAADAAQQQGPQ